MCPGTGIARGASVGLVGRKCFFLCCRCCCCCSRAATFCYLGCSSTFYFSFSFFSLFSTVFQRPLFFIRALWFLVQNVCFAPFTFLLFYLFHPVFLPPSPLQPHHSPDTFPSLRGTFRSSFFWHLFLFVAGELIAHPFCVSASCVVAASSGWLLFSCLVVLWFFVLLCCGATLFSGRNQAVTSFLLSSVLFRLVVCFLGSWFFLVLGSSWFFLVLGSSWFFLALSLSGAASGSVGSSGSSQDFL